ncbi:NAD(P)H:quinone oxidoreductase, type IV [Fimicolochytrium jonesii]|uniref:NAD(P)H:quinone oxidoreductase, type IV n=1 Tax=Fimicolochytrium jonesii TaxID=1396493 RepID=UPI0022FE3C48|nr:NAD(P)H:quinone oxidoreductase, type IV [Fimicolochytrium jonesii]KAI8822424.1 NAD(P)H:quinone oxidoreductase, type IV [Fimicolochytrium jonesii]
MHTPPPQARRTTRRHVPATTTTELTPTPHRKPKIYVVMYTTWGHTKTLADEIIKGIEAAGGEATLWRVPETLGADVLGKMHANLDAIADVPVITAENLTEADGFLFGLPTRYGTAPTQIKAFWDSTGGLWQVGALVGKYGGLFHTTATQHGGQETTSLTFLAHYVHHGILYVPLGYSCPILNDNTEVLGGSAYGAGTIAGGDGSRQPSAKELQVANWQGKEFAKILAKTV